MNNKVVIVIPSRNEIFLQRTILEILGKATGDIEVIPVLDGYDIPEGEIVRDLRVHYFKLAKAQYTQKRHAINIAISKTRSKYVMVSDAHCMFAKGFDEQLVKDHQDKWVQVPRRNRLDAENWCLQDQGDARPPIDYEYIIYRSLLYDKGIHGFKWDARTLERRDVLIDDIITFQGSCWFMTRAWFEQMGFMQTEGYTGWGQEAEEVSFTTWKNGGEVKVNKNTWYAHLHKGTKYGRMYWMSRDENRKSYAYSYNKWLIENKDFFISLVERFPLMPQWSANWKDELWKH